MGDNLDKADIARLRQRAVHDQYEAAREEYLRCVDEDRRIHLLALLLGHAPTDAEWARHEALRAEARYGSDADLTTDELAQMTGLLSMEIRRMVRRGEMPAPRRSRGTWWWKRVDITEWLAQRRLE